MLLRARCDLHRDVLRRLLLLVRLLYADGCVDHLSRDLCKTESLSLTIPEELVYKPLYHHKAKTILQYRIRSFADNIHTMSFIDDKARKVALREDRL